MQTLEGTWETIQTHSAELAGRYVKLTVFDAAAPDQDSFKDWGEAILQKARHISSSPSNMETNEPKDVLMAKALEQLEIARQRHHGQHFSDSTELLREGRDR